MNVTLLYPEASHIKEFMSERPPLGMAYIASFLEREGHKVYILDMNVEDDADEKLHSAIAFSDVIGISILSVFYLSAMELIKRIRKIHSLVPIIVGGAHVTALPERVLEENDVQFATIGEAEESFAEIVTALPDGDFSNIKGICYKNSNGVHLTERRPPKKDLDDLPFPARHLLNIDKYVNYMGRRRVGVMMTSRGCPFQCFYCSRNIDKTWRGRSPNNVVEEIEEIYHKYGRRCIYFHDDLFTFDKARLIGICKEILKRKLDITWLCASRVDFIDEERLFWMKKAGCRAIHYGIESGDQEIIKKMGKNITLEQAQRTIDMTKKHKIYMKGYFIIGFPWDTEETIKKTIDFALKSGTDELQFTMLMPYPGTPCWDQAVEEGSIDPNNMDWNVFSPTNLEVDDKVFFTKNLSADEIRHWRKTAYKKAMIHMVWSKVKKGDIGYIYNLVKEKRNLGLFRFAKNVFLKK